MTNQGIDTGPPSEALHLSHVCSENNDRVIAPRARLRGSCTSTKPVLIYRVPPWARPHSECFSSTA